MAPIVFLSFFWLLRLIPTTFVSLSYLYEAVEKVEEKKEEERKKERKNTCENNGIPSSYAQCTQLAHTNIYGGGGDTK